MLPSIKLKTSQTGLLAACVAALCASTAALAQSDKEPMRVIRAQNDYVVQADGKFSEDRELVYQVTHKSAVERAKRGGFSFSTSAQAGEVIHAYTEKPDGRRVDVRKDSFQFEVNKGVDANKPAYSDITTVSVVFPDVEVNDKVVFKYRVNTVQPVYANHFSIAEVYSTSYLYDQAVVSVTWPVSMNAKFTVNGCDKTESVNNAKQTATISMTCSNKNRLTKVRKNWSVRELEDEVGMLFSTHPDYASIATAYGKGALPKAVVTPRIEKLAKEIVGATTGQREKARLLYEWVATNIGYAGNCVGIGAVVPRDVDWTLENNLGDCKDHAAVLQALLTAQGIRSTQALVNAGSAYRLAKLPVGSAVNHVINYLPDFDLFVDSTSTSTPFGMLPASVYDKPVLLVENFVDGKRTPKMNSARNREEVKATVILKADGSAEGSAEVKQTGTFAIMARESARQITPENEERYLKEAYDRDGTGKGWAKYDREDPKALTDTYSYKMKFAMPDYMAPAPAGMPLTAPLSTMASPLYFAYSATEESNAKEIMCMGGSSSEELTFVFPVKTQIISVPKDVTYKNQEVSYTARYKRIGNKVIVKRTVEDKTPGMVCGADMQARFMDFGKKVMPETRAQLLYK